MSPPQTIWPARQKKLKHGHIDDDALAFAIYSTDGKMVLHDGDNGQDIPYSYSREGFSDGQLRGDNDSWRFLWLNSADGKYRIVVGQEWEYREDMALSILTAQLTPWLVALPLMLLILVVMLSRELRPLKKTGASSALARPGVRRTARPERCAKRSAPAG